MFSSIFFFACRQSVELLAPPNRPFVVVSQSISTTRPAIAVKVLWPIGGIRFVLARWHRG
jgi:hypothetical protein